MSQVSVDTQIPTFVVIKSDDGRQVDLKPADDLAAEMLIRAYVPEYFDGLVTFDEAYDLALQRDAQAANDLEASIMAVLDSEVDDDAETADAAAAINALLETAAMADAEISGVVAGL